MKKSEILKIAVIVLALGAILILHYLTLPVFQYRHAVYRILFYIPLILGSFWFGIKGSIIICAIVLLSYSPYAVLKWQGYTAIESFDIIMEGLLYIAISLLLGYLVEREKRLHQELIRNEGLAAMGRATAEIAHDMKTPLMAIGGFAVQVSRSLPDGDPNRAKLGLITGEIARMESMVFEMLDFSRSMEIHPTLVDLDELIRESVRVVGPLAEEKGIDLKINTGTAGRTLKVDAEKIKKVILNLLSNALEACRSGGTVSLEVKSLKTGIQLDVRDSGSGIEAEIMDQIFKPFFTTKKNGTGLGLAIATRIIEAHGGTITPRSNPEGGTTFSIHLPASQYTNETPADKERDDL